MGRGFVGDHFGVGVALDKRGRVVDLNRTSDGTAEDSAVAFTAGAVKANAAGCEDVAHAHGDRHRGNRFGVAAGATDRLHEDRIISEGDHARHRIAERGDRDAMPARDGRFVESNVAVVADAAEAGVSGSATERGESLGDFVGAEGVRHVMLPGPRAKRGVELADQLALKKTFEAERVTGADGTRLPVKPLIHLKDVHVAPGEAFAIGEVHQNRIRRNGADGEDQAGGLAERVASADDGGDAFGEVLQHAGEAGQETEAQAGAGAEFVNGQSHQVVRKRIWHACMMATNNTGRWGILALLFVSITINLLDRQVLSVMAPLIRDELKLSNTEYSYIVFAFLLGMTLAQVPAGLWLDRRGARWGLPAIMVVWSAANALHAAARSLTHFVAFRFLLGMGECGNYSAGVKVIAQRFPPAERALAGGLFNAGTVIGAFAAPPVLVAISQAYGWRWCFVLPSVLGLLWIVPWVVFYRDRERTVEENHEARPGFWPLLRLRQVWGAMLMRAMAGPVVHFYWYWLPEYLRRERHFSMEMIAQYAGIPFLFAGLGNVSGGLLANALMRRGWTADATRKLAFTLGAGLCGASLLVPFVESEWAALGLICAASFGVASMAANHIGLLTDLFEPRVLAGVTGLTGLTEGAVNMAVQLATGMIVDRYSYPPVFVAAGLMPAVALACLFGLIRRVEPVRIE